MTDKDLYQQILGLTSPWRVSDIDLHIDDEQILVRVVHDPVLGQALCPECRNSCPGYDTSDERRWRHLDTCQLKTYLVCSVPRVKCPDHGVRVAFIPWAEPGSNFTSAFETLGIKVLRATKVQSRAAELLRLSANQVHNLMHRAVGRGLVRRDRNEKIENVGIDEKSIRRGHSYMSILSNTDNGCVKDAFREFFGCFDIPHARPFFENWFAGATALATSSCPRWRPCFKYCKSQRKRLPTVRKYAGRCPLPTVINGPATSNR